MGQAWPGTQQFTPMMFPLRFPGTVFTQGVAGGLDECNPPDILWGSCLNPVSFRKF